MRFALGLPMMGHPIDGSFLSGSAIAATARAAEDAGFESVWVTEHPAPPNRWLESGGHESLDPFVALSFAAGATSRLRLLTNLTVLAYRNPFLLAKSVASLDQLSGGRVTLGVGAGYLKSEFRALGVDFEQRNALFDESIDLLRRIWKGESVSHSGHHFESTDSISRPPPTQDPLPVWIGGNSKLTRQRVARCAQGWMPMFNPRDVAHLRRSAPLGSVSELAGMINHIGDEAAAIGRDDPIDIAFTPMAEHPFGSESFDCSAYLASISELAEVGVTVVVISIDSVDQSQLLDQIPVYGEQVITPWTASEQ